MRFMGLCCFVALATLVVAGCGGSGPDLGAVTGKVTLDGNPLEGATVEFQPTGPGGSPSYGTTDASGSYELMFTFDKKGAIPGEHQVRISKTQPAEGAAAPSSDEDSGDDDDESNQVETLPAKYNAQTELKATVEPGKNSIDFPLTSG